MLAVVKVVVMVVQLAPFLTQEVLAGESPELSLYPVEQEVQVAGKIAVVAAVWVAQLVILTHPGTPPEARELLELTLVVKP
jgi:hypothetical protein